MKAKKALRRLTRAEALLSVVLDEYSAGEKDAREALDSAKASVTRAQESVNRQLAASAEKKNAAKKPVAKAKRKPVIAAKKRVKTATRRKRRVIVAKRKPAVSAAPAPLAAMAANSEG